MAADVSKHLERAKKFLEKNRVEDAISAYLAVLEESPQHAEASQALGDLYTRIDQPDRAVVYYGYLFDLLTDPKDETKALAIYNRFLKTALAQQAPERIARYAFLQQRQNRPEEAVDQYAKAAELFTQAGRGEDALFCLERTAQLDPDNLARQIKVAEAASQLGKNSLAARSFLRAGQLASVSGASQDALNFLGRAYSLAPQERSVALLYADAKLRNGEATEAVKLLEPFAATESDTAFLGLHADALRRSGQLDRARGVLERLLREKNEGVVRLFDLADAYADASQDAKSVELLQIVKRRMFADKKVGQFTAQLEELGKKHPESLPILEFWAALYGELNSESQYFEVLIRLFDANFNSGNFQKSSEVLERLVDIDSYDYRNQERLGKLRGRRDEGNGSGDRRRAQAAGAGRSDGADGDISAVRVAEQGCGAAAENRGDVSGRRRKQCAATESVPGGELVAENGQARESGAARDAKRRATDTDRGGQAGRADGAHRNVHRGDVAGFDEDFGNQPKDFPAADTARDVEYHGERSGRVHEIRAHVGGDWRAGAAAGDGRGILRAGIETGTGGAGGVSAGANGKSGAG